jgi:hypothetical protein
MGVVKAKNIGFKRDKHRWYGNVLPVPDQRTTALRDLPVLASLHEFCTILER